MCLDILKRRSLLQEHFIYEGRDNTSPISGRMFLPIRMMQLGCGMCCRCSSMGLDVPGSHDMYL